jgi:hypothetical protein
MDESHPLRSFTLGVINADNGGAGLSGGGGRATRTRVQPPHLNLFKKIIKKNKNP